MAGMGSGGWISLHRSLLDKPFFQKGDHLKLWIYLLLSANHQDRELSFNGSLVLVKRGQLLTGRKVLSRTCNIPESTVFRTLKYFESAQQIEQQKTNRYTLITIVNYDQYQKYEQPGEQPKRKKRTASEHPADTNNKDNKNNKPIEFILPASVSREAWNEFEAHRKEIRKPLKDRARKLAVKVLEKHPPNVQMEIVAKTILNGWVGLFEPKGNDYGAQDSKLSAVDRVRQARKRREEQRKQEATSGGDGGVVGTDVGDVWE